MKIEDMDALGKFWKRWMWRCKDHINSVCIFEPTTEELSLVATYLPDAEVFRANDDFHRTKRLTYDLNDLSTIDREFDLVIMSNVFMYSSDPDLWFENLKQRTRFLWMQDACDGIRGNNGNYLGEDGDMMRYSFTPHFTSEYEHAYDLVRQEEFMKGFYFYRVKPRGSHFLLFLDFNA